MSLLRVENLQKWFPVRSGMVIERTVDHVKAVDGVSFEIAEGETLGLVGESGSGKSTTGYCILQLLKPTGGSIQFEGTELTTLGREDLRRTRRDMQIVFQDPYASLNPRMTVGDIVGEPLLVHRIGDRKSRRATVRQLLDVVGFDPTYVNRYPHEFSGGQRQRIGIARALALNPKLIVCDEPVSALDVSIQAQILNLLESLQSEFDLTYVFISHDLSVIRQISDRIAVMYLGRVVETGNAEDIYEHPKHPYTAALLSAVPRAGAESRRRIVLGGDVPSPVNPPAACVFHPRCPRFHKGHCDVETPLLEPKNGQLAACHYPLEKWPMTDDEIRQAEGRERYAAATAGVGGAPAELPDEV